MTGNAKLKFVPLFLTLVSLALVVLAWLNFQQRRHYRLPDDGIIWVNSPEGVRAAAVTQNGPGDRIGIRQGEVLTAINGRPIHRSVEVTREIFRAGLGGKAEYELELGGAKREVTVSIGPQNTAKGLHGYLDIVGLLYLFIGAFILARRWGAAKSIHFYLFCLSSFVLYAFSYTGKLNSFDWTIYWLSVAALCAQPALFLHFCLTFPENLSLTERRPWITWALYAPGGMLLGVQALVASGWLVLPFGLAATRWALDRAGLFYLAIYFLTGAAALEFSYRRAQTPLRRQQLKWLTRGTLVAIAPFAFLYAVPYFLGIVPRFWMQLSSLSLIFLPLTFGYAIIRFRLMDVDVIFRRGIAYTLATLAIAGLYFGVVGVLAVFFHNWVSFIGRGGWILAIIVTAFLFQPLANWFQARLARFFSAERYDYRQTLLDFALGLNSERKVDRLLGEVTSRLSLILGVNRVAIFTRAPSGEFVLSATHGFTPWRELDLSFLEPGGPELRKGHLFFESLKSVYGAPADVRKSIRDLGLHYYLALAIGGRTLGYLGLGKTRENDFLSSEDLDLLKTLAGYLSIALENARLVESLEQEAREHQALRDFSESIVESINAGVLACGLDWRIESWNSPLEALYGLKRDEVIGKPLDEIFPENFLADLPRTQNGQPGFSAFKRPLRTADGRDLIVNYSMTPLVGRDAQVIGRLLILTDLTERVNLENQLIQAEKLSSIGLLAAGIAHEVNTPLAVIASQAQMLARQTPAGGPQTPVLEKIVKQSFRASEIVNNLLKFSRLSGSELAELDLNKILHETASIAEPMLRAAKIALRLRLASELPPIYGNSGKLQQVFMNLILNARDAMPLGGELTLTSAGSEASVRAEVSDNGVGIAPDHLSRIFDPFFTTKGLGCGTGLGLAVSYGIIRDHSGKVDVESRPGEGSTFRVELPAVRKPVHAA